MDRSRFGFGEYLTADTTAPDTNDDKLNRVFDRVEASADERMLDVITRGVVSGMEVTEAAVPNMTIRVLAGIAYDQTGRRLEIPSTQSIDPLTDFGGSPIALPDSGKEKYSSIYIKSSRLNQESTQDSNSVQYYQSELEHFVIRVRGGSQAPAGTATPPALVGDEILLADILLVNGMTTITDGDIDLTTRRQTSSNVGALDETALQHTNGSEKSAGNVNPPASGDMRTWLRQLVTDLGKTTATTGAQRIGHVALGNYADASSGPGAGGIGGQLSSWFTAMSASGGTAKVGSAALSGSPTNVGAGTLLQTLQALLNAINDRPRLGAAETITAKYTFDLASPGTGIETASDTTADFNGPVTLDGAVTATAKITCDLAAPGTGLETAADTTADFNGPVNLDGAVTQTAALVKSGTGATTAWRITDSSDGDGTYDITYDEYRVPNTLGGARVYTLRSSTSPIPTDGHRVRFSRTGSLLTNTVTFKREDATTLASIAAGTPAWVEFAFYNTEWRVVAWGGNTTVSGVS